MFRPLASFADVHYGRSPSNVVAEEGSVPIYGTGGIYGKASKSLFPGPAVIIPRKGSLSSPHFAQEPFWPSDTTYAAIPKRGVDAMWLFYQLSQFNLEALNEATGVPSISRDWLVKSALFPHDPDSQIAVARVLHAIDSQIDTTEALIAKQDRVRAGLIYDLFTRGLDECGQLRPSREEAPHLYNQTELGWLPKGWEVSQISDMIIAARAGCSVNSLGRPAFADEAGILKTSCVANGSFEAAENKAVEPEEYRRLREPVAQGAIIVSRMNTPDLVGESGIVVFAAPGLYLPDRLWQLHPKSSVNSYWLSRLLQFHNVKERIKALSTGTSGTMKNIDKAKFLSLSVPKPSFTEMGQLHSALNPVENNRMTLAAELTKLRLQKSGLMQDLLTGKVPVAPLLKDAAA